MQSILVPKYNSEAEQALSALNLMISERKDELETSIEEDKILEFLYGGVHKRKAYYANDEKIKQLRDEVVRIESISVPESYSWYENE